MHLDSYHTCDFSSTDGRGPLIDCGGEVSVEEGSRGGGKEEAYRKVLSSIDVSPKVEEEVAHFDVAMRCGTHERRPSLEWEG